MSQPTYTYLTPSIARGYDFAEGQLVTRKSGQGSLTFHMILRVTPTQLLLDNSERYMRASLRKIKPMGMTPPVLVGVSNALLPQTTRDTAALRELHERERIANLLSTATPGGTLNTATGQLAHAERPAEQPRECSIPDGEPAADSALNWARADYIPADAPLMERPDVADPWKIGALVTRGGDFGSLPEGSVVLSEATGRTLTVGRRGARAGRDSAERVVYASGGQLAHRVIPMAHYTRSDNYLDEQRLRLIWLPDNAEGQRGLLYTQTDMACCYDEAFRDCTGSEPAEGQNPYDN